MGDSAWEVQYGRLEWRPSLGGSAWEVQFGKFSLEVRMEVQLGRFSLGGSAWRLEWRFSLRGIEGDAHLESLARLRM